MKIRDLNMLVEQAIIGERADLIDYGKQKMNAFDEYEYSCAMRLIKAWDKQKNNINFKTDFECALRNYLLVVKKELVIKGYEPSKNFSKFGMEIDSDTGRIIASQLLPNYIDEYHAKQLYMQDDVLIREDTKHDLTTNAFIRELTGFQKFKSYEQKLAVMGAMRTPEGYTCLVSMPTGAGKSLITQTLAYSSEGLTIVIVPTISLMLDQTKNAKIIIKSDTEEEIFYYYSGCDLTKFYSNLEKRKAKLLFVSPESLIKNIKLRDCIEKANEEGYLKNLIIDEAHIIIEWGSSFRIDFQCLDTLKKNYLRSNQKLRTFLLSATYSDETIRQLKLFYSNNNDWIEIRCDHLRHETRYDIIKCPSYYDKAKKIKELITLLPHPMIVYVKSPEDAEKLKSKLNEYGFMNIETFTGKTTSNQREKIIDEWKNDEFDLMIATCAFGVGVDKKDVRTVLHTYIPENPNKYYQEAGRGGRDGLPCLSTMVYVEDDVKAAFSFIDKVITTEKLSGRWFSILNSSKTQPLLHGEYKIDTYVKPNYNSNEEFIDYISEQDVNWNVKVILLLRRNGVLSIESLEYLDDKYIFYVKILNRKLLEENQDSDMLLGDIRDTEWKKIEQEYMLMKKSLQRVGKTCWSSMFNKIYRETEEYCAGCNSHKDIINYEYPNALRINIDSPLMNIGKDMRDYSYNSKCMLIIKNSISSILKIIKKDTNVVVSDEKIISNLSKECIHCRSELLYCNYFDFYELTTSNKYYASGVIAIYIPQDISIQRKIISIVETNTKKYDIEYILFADADYYLPFKGKNLSEVINGPCKQEY